MSAAVSAIAALATIIFSVLTALRAQYDRVLNVLDYISSSEIADARHRLGLVIYGGPVHQEEIPDRIADLFAILWAFGRVNAVRLTLSRNRALGRVIGGPEKLLRSNVEPWARFWSSHLDTVGARLNSPEVEGSDHGLMALAEAWLPRPN